MSDIPADLKYSKSHEWIEVMGNGDVTVGITAHAQDLLGDMVYVELPEVGREISAEEEIAVVESVKAAADIYAPISGVVTEINETLADQPESINNDPFGDGWLFRLKPTDADELEKLLDADEYRALIEAE
ncbi:MAG: glycine cleavage system protein GcvH [Gammaproteobacteria bacterium]|nr:glycine cleavage system protein GcvH [Gammaproteobacteria bacterium]